MIKMPPRNSIQDKIAIAASRCLLIACERSFEEKNLEDVVQIVSGGTPSTDNFSYWDGDIAWITPKDLGKPHDIEITSSERYLTAEGLHNSSARIVPIGTVLLSSRAPIGHLGIAATPLATNQGFKNLICSEHINSRYLFHMLRASIDDLEALGRGNTFKEITSGIIKKFSIPLPPLNIQIAVANFLDCVYQRLNNQDIPLSNLPTPLEEQRHIVARIEELARKIEEAKGLRREAVEEGAKLYDSFLERAYNTAVSLAGGVTRLDDLCTSITDGTHSTPTYVSEGIPFLSVKDITSGEINFDNVKYIPQEEHEFLTRRCKPEYNDILLTKIGTTGFAKVIDVDRDFSIFVSLALLKLDKTLLNPKYTEYMLNSPKLKASSEAGTRGVGNKNLVLKFIREFPMPAPTLPEQERIVLQLQDVQAQITTLKRKQAETEAELNALLPSILDKAFKGEL